MMVGPSFIDNGRGERLAYHLTPAAAGRAGAPTLVWLGGFMSDMEGTKALTLEAHCAARGLGFLRFDYSGHGASDGAFADGTISRWRDDALAIIDQLTTGALLLIGSSMGGWIALLAALARRERVAGILGIAAAPDFTERFMWAGFSEAERAQLMREGRLVEPTPYGSDPYIITRALIEDGRRHLLLDAPRIDVSIPVHMLQGQRDDDVPWRHALEIADKLAGSAVAITLVKDGDHRLSRPQDLALLTRTVDGLVDALMG